MKEAFKFLYKMQISLKPYLKIVSNYYRNEFSLLSQMESSQQIIRNDIDRFLFENIDQFFFRKCQSIFQANFTVGICVDQMIKFNLIIKIMSYIPGTGRRYTIQLCQFILNNIADIVCPKFTENFKRISENLRNSLNQTLQSTLNNLTSSTGFFKPTESFFEIWPSLSAQHQDLIARMDSLFGWLIFTAIISDIFFLLVFLIGFIQSINYHNRYIRFKNFDNFYVDQYFRMLDSKRKLQNKIHLLPLCGSDQKQLVPTWALHLIEKEKFINRSRKNKSIILIAFILLLIYADWLLSDLVSNLSLNLSKNSYAEIIVHRFEGYCYGGTLARKLNEYLSRLHFNYQKIYRHDLNSCSLSAHRILWPQYISMGKNFLLTILSTMIATHLARIRHLICDYFYHRQSKIRILYLYNQRLLNRKRFLKEQKKRIKNLSVSS